MMSRLIVCGACLLALVGGPAAAADAKPATPPKPAVKSEPKKEPVTRHELTPPSYLPELAREYLHRRMDRHGRDMQELMFSVVLLSREVARDTATRIATELAHLGFAVTLTTTDPAAHVEQAVANLGRDASKLRVTRIDPQQALRYE